MPGLHTTKNHLLLLVAVIVALFWFKEEFKIHERNVKASNTNININQDGSFSPSKVTITSGNSVSWTNTSDDVQQPASDPHPEHTNYPDLNVGDIQPGSSASTVSLTRLGTWCYHNHNVGGVCTGTIIVVSGSIGGGGGGCYSDCTPPGIISFSEVTSGSLYRISWVTNEPSTTKLEYGPYLIYSELQKKVVGPDDKFKIEHSVVLSGLVPKPLYYYRVYTEDAAGNTQVTPAEGHIFVFLPQLSPRPTMTEPTAKPLEQKPSSSPISDLKTVVHLTEITRTLGLGYSGKEVGILQQVLAKDAEIYPEGFITWYFGPLTERAVKLFQKKYRIIDSGTAITTGHGVVGPKTRVILNKLIQYPN